ncbi:carbon-nitrogen hydrolase family protein [Salinivibrio sp. ES.052]|uniref:carbon-nitrogen hydrolase family protein n=1 Tax=Salinivibrio sp. ES.052 TaxID=1882823 RepID=UPI000925A10C|nr:carbon-nitrogen hydrolase family protein [Salinivibrio sp. ES.052]SIO41448.1 Predicted amidohydrolase [Salinivibrio sp. ES.052]
MIKAGVIQMTSSADPAHNMKTLQASLHRLSEQGVKLALTPENALVFGGKRDYQRHAERLGQGPLQQQLAELAHQYDLWLVVGAFPIQNDNGMLSSTSLVFDNAGHLRGSYDKLHLFDVEVGDAHGRYCESDYFAAGDRLTTVDTPFGCLGLSICYDVRFAPMYQALRTQGADVITIPAAFTRVTGQAHWEALLRARAIETQCWVIAAGQCGEHSKGRQTWGHSMIIDPWGQVVASLGSEPGVTWAELDLSVSESIRGKMPVQSHTRLQSQLK